MAQVKFHKFVAALPAELEADAIYYVRSGDGYDQYVTNGSGMIVGYPANAALALAGKVDKAPGQTLLTEAERTKLGGIAAGATANSTDAQLRNRATHTGTQAISTVTGLQTALDNKINTTERGVSGGVATLDEFARIPSSQLPSYVDDVLEFPTLANFPAVGEGGKIYIAVNQGTQANPTRQYRWTGSVYAEINPSPGTTDALAEGSTNLYFSEHRVRNTLLTGLSMAVSTAITAADTVLSALGKLQAQLGQKANLDSPAFTGNPTAPTPAAGDNNASIATTAHVKAAMALFGVGSNAPPITVSDLNSLVAVGRWTDGGVEGVLNRPAGFSFGEIVVAGFTTAYETQTYTTTTGRRAFRSRTNGVWGAWRELFHTGNLVKQTSPTDTTAGALMAVEAFGLGARDQSVLLDDYANLKETRFFRYYPGTAGGVPFGSGYGVGLHIAGSAEAGGYGGTLLMDYVNNEIAFRRKTAGSYTDPLRLYHTGNFDPAAKQDISSVVAISASRTLALSDAGNYLRPTATVTLTVPTNDSVAFPVNTEITVRSRTGNTTLSPASGVTLRAPAGGTLVLNAGMTVTLKKVGTNEWDVIGQTVPA